MGARELLPPTVLSGTQSPRDPPCSHVDTQPSWGHKGRVLTTKPKKKHTMCKKTHTTCSQPVENENKVITPIPLVLIGKQFRDC